MAQESKRGCGYRKVGGTYLVGNYISVPCDRLPYPNKRFTSFEPLLGKIGIDDHVNIKSWVDWVIIGAQTKPTVYPNIEWVAEIIEAADKAHIPVFLKK